MDKNYFRNNSYLSRYMPHRSRTGSRSVNKNLANTIANQLIISSVICLVIIIMSNFTGEFITKIFEGVKWVVGEDYDFKAASASIKDFFPRFQNEGREKLEEQSGLSGNTSALDASSSSLYNMTMPLKGEITSGFGMRQDPITKEAAEHTGIDIYGELGTPIMAAMDGIVIKAEESETLGKYVRVKHEDGLETLYGHCSELLVAVNQPVKRGDIIAKVGDTGTATSAHLHFEVIKNGVPVDPMTLLGNLEEPI